MRKVGEERSIKIGHDQSLREYLLKFQIGNTNSTTLILTYRFPLEAQKYELK